MVAKVLGKTGIQIKVCVVMYKVEVQEVLLYGRKILVVMDMMMMMLEVFHHIITGWIFRNDSTEGKHRGIGVGIGGYVVGG